MIIYSISPYHNRRILQKQAVNLLRWEYGFFILIEVSCSMTKPTKWPVRPVKTQISLGIRPVWSESFLTAWRNIGPLTTYWAHSKGYDQTGWMPRLIQDFAGHPAQFVGLVMRRLKLYLVCKPDVLDVLVSLCMSAVFMDVILSVHDCLSVSVAEFLIVWKFTTPHHYV